MKFSDLKFTITADSPQDVVNAIRAEVQRRFDITQAHSLRARTQRESARYAGELSALQGLVNTLDNTTVNGR